MENSIYKQLYFTYSDFVGEYSSKLLEFLNEFEDNTELYFIAKQLVTMEANFKSIKEFIINLKEEDENKEEILDLFENRINTNYRIKDFLNNRKKQLELNSESIFKDINQQPSELFWNGTELEFTELIKALHESNLISRLNDKGDIKQNFLFAEMRKLFNVSDYNENDKIKEIRKRKDKKTPLLHLLEKNLLEFINKKDELKKNS